VTRRNGGKTRNYTCVMLREPGSGNGFPNGIDDCGLSLKKLKSQSLGEQAKKPDSARTSLRRTGITAKRGKEEARRRTRKKVRNPNISLGIVGQEQ